jgi:hypothetical protein
MHEELPKVNCCVRNNEQAWYLSVNYHGPRKLLMKRGAWQWRRKRKKSRMTKKRRHLTLEDLRKLA